MDDFINNITKHNYNNTPKRKPIYDKVYIYLEEIRNSNKYTEEQLKQYVDFFEKQIKELNKWIKVHIPDLDDSDEDIPEVYWTIKGAIEKIEQIIALLKKMIAKIDFKNYIEEKMKDPEMATVIKDICASAPSNYNEIKF